MSMSIDNGLLLATEPSRNTEAARSSATGARATASLLLAAIVAALVVVANQVIDTWTDGHLLVTWLALWAVAFAATALLAAPVRRVAQRLRSSAAAWNEQRRLSQADARLWQIALDNPEVMADICCALARSKGE